MFNFQEHTSPFHLHKNYSASKTLFDNAIYEIAEDDADELSTQKIFVPIMIVGLGNTDFVRQ